MRISSQWLRRCPWTEDQEAQSPDCGKKPHTFCSQDGVSASGRSVTEVPTSHHRSMIKPEANGFEPMIPNRSGCAIHRLRLCICQAATGSRECERQLQFPGFSRTGVHAIRTTASQQTLNTSLDHGCPICPFHRNVQNDHFRTFP